MDRKEYAHVTQILDLLPHEKLTEWRIKTGKAQANAIVRKASKAGSSLHEFVESVMARREGEAIRPPKDIVGKIWAEWWGLQAKPIVVAQEKTFYEDELGVQGTPDLVMEFGDGLEIVDWKLTNAIREKNLWQLGAYGRLVEMELGKRVVRGRVVRLDQMLGTWEEATLDEEELVQVGIAFEKLAIFYKRYLALPERFRE